MTSLRAAALVVVLPFLLMPAVAWAATIQGQVQLDGPIPEAKRVKITKNPEVCGSKPLFSEQVLVSPGKGLANVLVYVEGVKKGKPAKPGAATLDNRGCRYEPHVQAVVVGTELSVKNSDPILHNTHARTPKQPVFNFALPTQGQVTKHTMSKPGLVKVGCDAGHTWMSAYIGVFPHPYFAVTDSEGNFKIEDLPAGEYEVVFWHEKLGSQKLKVDVSAGDQTLNPRFK